MDSKACFKSINISSTVSEHDLKFLTQNMLIFD